MGDKTVHVNLRLTEPEQKHIDKQSDKYGIKRSEYIRRLVEQDMGRVNLSEMKTQEAFLQKKELIYEINRIGNNVNQIAKNVNSGRYTDYEKKKLFAMMDKLNELLAERL